MTSFPPEPEFWIEDADGAAWPSGEPGAGDGSGPSEPAGPSGPHGPHRRWVRWVAAGAGLAVIAGLIVWQNRANTTAGDGASTEQTSTSAPSTDLRTGEAATDGTTRAPLRPPPDTEGTPGAATGWMMFDTGVAAG